jgi:lysophospholipase L1-like esterase
MRLRKKLNEWIRSTDLIDGYVDFDKVMQDENDPDKIPAHLTEEGLHPSVQGAKVLAKAFYDKFVK